MTVKSANETIVLAIERLLAKHDTERLIELGAPASEYRREATEIARDYATTKTVTELASTIESVFHRNFDLTYKIPTSPNLEWTLHAIGKLRGVDESRLILIHENIAPEVRDQKLAAAAYDIWMLLDRRSKAPVESEKWTESRELNIPSSNRPEDIALFLKNGMERLRTTQLKQGDHELLIALVELTSSKELILYIRRWLEQFSGSRACATLVGKWFLSSGSNEASYSAAHHIKTTPNVDELRHIVMAVAEHPGRSHRLYPLLAARLEQQPASVAWSKLQSAGKSSKAIDGLILRWLELNQGNAEITISVSFVALTTSSRSVLESIIGWMKPRIRDEHSFLVAMHLLRSEGLSQPDLKDAVFRFAREWLAVNANSEHCGSVFGDLIMYSLDPIDAANGLDWYHEHRESSFASRVLRGLLRASALRNEEPDLFVCEESTIVLKQMESANQEILLAPLLLIQPNPELIGLARKVCFETRSGSLLAKLIKVSPEPDLLSLALDCLNESPDAELIHSYLKVEPGNEQVRKLARKWMQQNSSSKLTKSLSSMLA